MAHPDPSRANVVLELLCDGANNSTTFTDTSPVARTVTTNGGAKISTTGRYLGTGHALFSASGDYLSCANSTDFYPGSGDFTVDGWIYPNTVSGYQTICGYANGSASNSNFSWQLLMNGTGLQWNVFAGSTSYGGTLTGVFAANAWHYFMVVKSGNDLKASVGGVFGGSLTSVSGTVNNPASSVLHIGRLQGFYQLSGRLLLRITKGVARHTSNFTPTGYFEEGRSKLAGTVVDASNNPVSRTVKVIRCDDWVVTGSEASDAGTGAWEIWTTAKEDVEHRIIRVGSDSPLEQDVIERAYPILPS